LTLPSASFRQLLTKLTLPQLMDSSISAHEGLEPSTLTSCTAHIGIVHFLEAFSRYIMVPLQLIHPSIPYFNK
ncbi:hypothetical protein, partial [Candidatus Bandiella numerosa]|uniref:hypothetical protein n=1 Tax=Candidatus Bandiella numerosa TaxID=2570586 RepID=UPI001F374627